ncbi:MAG: DUF86 domain-containing protein [Candidatus Peregrinibacteria bacterium]
MTKDPLLLIGHILEAIDLIQNYTKDKQKSEFLGSRELQDAVIRRIAIIGEAIRNFSPAVLNQYPALEWKAMVAMRNILIHDYEGVHMERVWKVVTREIAPLKRLMLRIKHDLEK